MNFGSLETMSAAGFSGGSRIEEFTSDFPVVPRESGVYLVGHENHRPHNFLCENPAGHFKERNPTVECGELKANWVDGAAIVYIGKSGGSGLSANLHGRIHTLLKFGRKDPVAHWGGRYLWQLADSGRLRIFWKTTPTPEVLKSQLMEAFKGQFSGRLPFANLRAG